MKRWSAFSIIALLVALLAEDNAEQAQQSALHSEELRKAQVYVNPNCQHQGCQTWQSRALEEEERRIPMDCRTQTEDLRDAIQGYLNEIDDCRNGRPFDIGYWACVDH